MCYTLFPSILDIIIYAYDYDLGYPLVFCLAIQLILHTFRHLKKIVSI